MNSLKLRIVGMHCESCEKSLKKALSKLEHIKEIDLKYSNEVATIKYNPELNINDVIGVIRNVGYDAIVLNGNEDYGEVNFKKYINVLKQKNRVEKHMVYGALGTLLIFGMVEFIAYYGFFNNIPDFFDRFGYYFIFLVISIVLGGTSIWHIKCYGDKLSCMSGMMIGMTTGMINGFLIGMIVGATNGMFIGTIIGILIGILVGIWTGKCCGIMGIMEGMMAGLMGGLMGAMTSLMLINDHLKIIVPILVVISSIILIGLDYMVFKEVRNIKEKVNKYDFVTFLTVCFIILIALNWVMVYGPKSALFQ